MITRKTIGLGLAAIVVLAVVRTYLYMTVDLPNKHCQFLTALSGRTYTVIYVGRELSLRQGLVLEYDMSLAPIGNVYRCRWSPVWGFTFAEHPDMERLMSTSQ